MSLPDVELMRFVAPWIGLGFLVTLILSVLRDVRGAIVAFGLGAIAPVLVYLPSSDMALAELALGWLRVPIPFYLEMTGVWSLAEMTLDWWLGGAFGAAIAIAARRTIRS